MDVVKLPKKVRMVCYEIMVLLRLIDQRFALGRNITLQLRTLADRKSVV